jgi:hypothetical protein
MYVFYVWECGTCYVYVYIGGAGEEEANRRVHEESAPDRKGVTGRG